MSSRTASCARRRSSTSANRKCGRRAGTAVGRLPPDYAKIRRSTSTTRTRNGNTQVVEYRVERDTGAQARARQLLFVAQPYANHNGGQLAFGPDGCLYFGMGDGGSGGDPRTARRTSRSLFGKLLALDVEPTRPGPRSRRSACATRGASRSTARTATSTSATSARARARRSTTAGGAPPGSRTTAGTSTRAPRRSRTKPPRAGQARLPVAQYTHGDGCSITGGFVYRGAHAWLRGRYFYGDYCSGIVWSLKVAGGTRAVCDGSHSHRQEPDRSQAGGRDEAAGDGGRAVRSRRRAQGSDDQDRCTDCACGRRARPGTARGRATRA